MDLNNIEYGRWLFAGDCTFLLSAVSMQGMPESNLPEVAFVGRSNVGKSSIINALTNRKNLTKTSNTPGRTRQINFFNLRDKLMLVDLPGYGYAKVPKSEKEKWNKLIIAYLKYRSELQRVCLLIDARVGVKENDVEVMQILDSLAVNYQIILTKTDKVKRQDVDKIIDYLKENANNFPALHPIILPTSAEKCIGIEQLRAELAGFTMR